MNRSPTLSELGKALAIAQGKMRVAIKDSKNPFFKSTYADLASVWAACREALTSNGLSVIQFPVTTDEMAGISSMLLHTSGEFVEEEFLLPVKDKTAQGFGSAFTYSRRFALAAIAGIVADDDDDGQAASTSPAARASKTPVKDYLPPASKLSPEYARLASGIAFAGDSSKVDVVAAEARDSAAKGLLTSSEATMLRDLFAAKRAAMSGKGDA